MHPWLAELLICPHCPSDDALVVTGDEISEDRVIEGRLSCRACGREYPVTGGIPRFVDAAENYAENFGFQWRRFRAVQIDRFAGHSLSGTRLLADTRWSPQWMAGQLILDAGCGAGRFTDELAQNGARVVACDLSSAVEACRETVDDPAGHAAGRGEVAVVQANLLALPFRPGAFDAVHCAGVLQHTPEPERIMRTLPDLLKAKGRLFLNFYEIDVSSKFQVIKYGLRRWTPDWRMPTLVAFCRWMCRILFFPSWLMSHVPLVRFFNRFLPICAVHPAELSLRQQFDLTLLDTVDWYGPRYEIRQDHRKVAALLAAEGLEGVDSASGLAWAVKPEERSP